MYKVLIQLIGDQTLPNIFPVLAIKPQRVVNIYTEKTEAAHKKITSWFKKYGAKYHTNPTFVKGLPIGTTPTNVWENVNDILFNERDSVIQREEDVVFILNMTGGTKLMVTSAIILCNTMSQSLVKQGKRAIPFVYLNPETKKLDCIANSQQEHEIIVSPIRDIKLSVEEIIASGGDVELTSHKKNWQAVYPAALRLQELADKESNIYFNVNQINNDNYATEATKPISSWLTAKDEDKLKKHREAMKALAKQAEEDKTIRKGFEMCGFTPRDGDFYFDTKWLAKVADVEKIATKKGMRQARSRKQQLVRDLNNCTNFFVGGWWEVIVAHAYQQENPESEVLWSVETASSNNKSHPVETDIVASDGYSLCCISCKRDKHKNVTQELEQHCARSSMLGGSITKTIMAIHNKHGREALTPLAQALRLTIWNSETIKESIQNKERKNRWVTTQADEESGDSYGTSPNFLQRLAAWFSAIFSKK